MSWDFTQALHPAEAGLEQAEEAHFEMGEQEFRLFYEQTARRLWAYARRLCGDSALADDLVQESYYRFLQAKLNSSEEAYRRNYLFRIATNLARDQFRRAKWQSGSPPPETAANEHHGHESGLRSDVGHVLETMKPRERTLLWLAYVEGASHREIAAATGAKEASIRPMLFRARRKMAGLLRKRGLGTDALRGTNV